MDARKAKAFKSGNSVAVRLPRIYGVAEGDMLTIDKVGSSIKLTPVIDPVEEKRKLTDLIAALRAIGPVGEIQERDGIEFPDRPGLY